MKKLISNMNRSIFQWLVGSLTVFLILNIAKSDVWSQPGYGDWYQVQAMEATDLGIENPAGLVFSPESNLLFTLSLPDQNERVQNFLRLNLFGDSLDINTLAEPLSNPLNTAYYAPTESLFFFDLTTGRPEMVQVQIGLDGAMLPVRQTTTRFNAHAYGVLEAQGITFDPVQRRLYILDTGLPGPVLIRVTADPGHSFDGDTAGREGRLHRTRLSDLKGHTLRGLAFNPHNEHLYTFDVEKQLIYELTIGGDIVSIMNVAELNLTNPQGMVFAASADATDDPANMNLFLADSGSNNDQNITLNENWLFQSMKDSTTSDANDAGQIVEISFRTAVAPASLDAASLVNIIDTSKATWNPSSPDPAGIAYRPAVSGLLISDSEVEENHPDYQGFNVFESTTAGDLFANCVTTEFSNEPTGAAVNPTNGHIFFTDDNANAVFEVDLGPDGTYCTVDDFLRTLNTAAFNSDDPEGLGYGDNKLFISDGVNQEVYVVDLGANGVIGGNGADADNLEYQFDTFALGLRDPEGMEYNSINGTLFIVSTYGSDDFLVEVTTDGTLITSYDLSFLGSTPRSGLAYGPGSLDPANYTIYIASRGVDNGSDPNENDGKVYEIDIGPSGPPPPPTANFSGTPTNGDAPLTVDFTDLSTGAPTSWSWDFGDNNTSTEQNPNHTYNDPGTYTVSLTVSNSNGSDTDTKVDYIVVNAFVNDPPVAVDDSASAVVNTPVIIDAVANDIDVDGNLDPSSAAIISTPSNGIVSNNGDGSFTYTPNTNFQGVDSFNYQVCDTGTDLNGSTNGDDLCDTATVTVSVSSGANYRSHSTASTEDATQLTIPKPGGVVSGDTLIAFLMSSQNGSMIWTPPAGWSEIGTQYSSGSYAATAWYKLAGSSEPNNYTWVVSAENEIIGTIFAVSGADSVNPINAQLREGGNLPNALQVTTSVDDALLILWGATDASSTQSWSNPDGMTEHFDLTQTATWLTHAGYTGSSGSAGSYSRTIAGTAGGSPLGWLVAVAPSAAPANNLPIAVDDSATANEDSAVTITVLANDSDLDGDSLTVDSVTQGSNGSVAINPNDTVTYTPAANFNGADSFSYTISDGNGGTATADVNITVSAVNDAPTASDDNYVTGEDTALNVAAPGLLANDNDVDGDPLSAVLVSGVINGSLSLNADGSFNYMPNADFNGVDAFTYIANDGTADSNEATVTITINAVNDVPAAVDDSYAIDEDTILNVAAPGLLGNDSDTEDDPLTATLVSDVSSGSLTLNPDGSFSYTPNAGFNGVDAFTYTANDGTADSNIATVTITVNAINDAPTAVDDSYAMEEDTTLNVAAPGVLGNDSDQDGDTLTAVLASDVSNGSLTLNNDGSFDYTPNAGFSGSDTFTYTAGDGTAVSNVATVTIAVNPVNDPPIAADDSYSTDEDTLLTITAPGVLDNDSDPENGPLTAVLVTDVNNGSLTLNSDGSFEYTPNANFNGTDSFTYTAHDGVSDSNVATVAITINPVNDAPIAADDSASTNEDTPVTITVLANDGDVDGDSLTVDSVTQGSNGSVAINPDETVTYTPAANFNGADSFSYTISDGNGGTDTANVNITVNPFNNTPAAVDDSYTTDEDAALNVVAPGVLDNDTDLDSDPLTAVLVSDVSNGSLTLNPDGSFSYTPTSDFNGVDTFTYSANDGTADSNNATVTITVNPINDAPAAVDDSYTSDEDTTLNVTAPGVLSNDSDVDGDPLNAVLISGVTNGILSLNSDGSFTYAPNLNFNGVDTFTYAANDGVAGSNTATVTISVNAVNDAPVAADDSATTDEDTAITITVLANDSDIDGDSLTVDSVTQGSNGSVTINLDETITYTPAANFNGADSFNYTISDGNGGTATAVVNITINAVNDAPIAADDGYTIDEDTILTVTAPGVLSNDSDPENDPLTAALISDVSNGSLTLNPDGSFSYTPTSDFNGVDTFTYIASDGTAGSNTATVTITINSNETIIDSVAASETSVAGTVSGNYTNTHSDDGIAESIMERESGGRPSTRYSYLEHKWIIDVAPGNIITLYANAWSSGSTDGDSFIFAYSTNDVTYTDMFIVNNTSDGAPLSYILPASIQGTVYIRVTDSNRNIGNVALDSIYVDHLYIRSESELGIPPAAPTGLNAEAISVSQVSLTWTDNAADENGFYIQRSVDNTNWILIDTVGPDVINYIDVTVFPGTTYFYRVRAFNTSGSSDYSNTATVTTPEGLNLTGIGYKVQGVHTVDLTWSGGNAAFFDIYRDGILIASGVTGNTFTDFIGLKGSGSYQYQVCEAGNPINCSNIIQIDF